MTPKPARSSNHIDRDAPASPGSGYVVGVDIGGTNLRLALADRSGTVVARWSCSIATTRGADAIVELICVGVEDLFQQASAPQSALKAIGAGVCGITDVDAGMVIVTSYLMGWRDVPLRTLLEAKLAVPTIVDNDVNVAAIGEGWVGAAEGKRDFVFIAIGTGIGAGIVLGGRPFRGAGWAAGEIGYMLVPGTPEEPIEHGKPGALEGMIGGEGVKAQWQNLWSEDATPLPKNLTATQIFDHALRGDPLARTILNQSARMLSHTIYNISLVLNTQLFVLGGGVGMHSALYDTTQAILRRRGSRINLQLICSALGAEAQLMGAIRLALDTADIRDELQ